jgi:hypothetical protein
MARHSATWRARVDQRVGSIATRSDDERGIQDEAGEAGAFAGAGRGLRVWRMA